MAMKSRPSTVAAALLSRQHRQRQKEMRIGCTVLVRILSFLPLPDLPAAARAHSSIAIAIAHEALWTARLDALPWAPVSFWHQRINELITSHPSSASPAKDTTTAAPALSPTREDNDDDDDGFGDFEQAASQPASTATGAAPKSFFDVDFSSHLPAATKVPTSAAGTQVLFSATPYRRFPSPDKHDTYRKVRAYTTLLRPLATYLLQAIPDDFLQGRVQAGTAPRELSLLGDDSIHAHEQDEDASNDNALPFELTPTYLWSHPSLPNGSTLTWNDQAALLSNLVRFLSPTPAHRFQGVRTPPPTFAWKYEGGLWPWPSSQAETAELLSRLTGPGRTDLKGKRASFAGIWRVSDAVRHESRGYELPSRRGGSPPPGSIPEDASPNPDKNAPQEVKTPNEMLEMHLRRSHQLHILTLALLSHATALEHTVLLPVFEGAGERKKDAERAAGLLGTSNQSDAAPASPLQMTKPAFGTGATADSVRRAEETMASAARAAWSLRRAFIVRDVLKDSRALHSKAKARSHDEGVSEPVGQEEQLLGTNVGPGMLARPPATSVESAEGSSSTLPNGPTNTTSSSTPATTLAGVSETVIIDSTPKLTRTTATELAALGYRLFQTFLTSLPILQRTSTLRRSHDPRSNIISFSLPPLASQSSTSYNTGTDLDFGPMADAFIPALTDALREGLELVRRLFPGGEGQDVDVQLLRRVVEVVLMGEYVDGLMAQIANLEKSSGGGVGTAGMGKWVEDIQGKPPLSLRALPAAFAQAMRLPTVLIPETALTTSKDAQVANNKAAGPGQPDPEHERARLRAEDVIYLAFEPRMDAYLANERDWVQRGMDRICARWSTSNDGALICSQQQQGVKTDEAFLASANPAAAKKSFLTSFKDVLLVPVSVVPRTANFVSGAVVSTFAPRRRDTAGGVGEDGGGGGGSAGLGVGVSTPVGRASPNLEMGGGGMEGAGGGGYMDFSKGGDSPFGIGDDEDDEETEEKGRDGDHDDDGGFGFSKASSGSNPSPFAASEANEWASADHAIGPAARVGAASPGSSSAPAAALDEGWGDFASSSVASSSASSAGLSTRRTSVATTATTTNTAGGRLSVVSSSAQQLAPPFVSVGGPASGRSTPTPGYGAYAGSGRSTPQPIGRSGTPVPKNRTALSRLQLLLSLDVALELIHLNRDTLKRIETFRGFPGAYGMRVRQEIEGIAVVFLQTLSEKHLTPGLKEATEQVKAWIPAEHDSSSSTSSKRKKNQRLEEIANARMGRRDDGSKSDEAVEPLVHFFELVHVGDAIQQMVQVYFDQELSRHVDRTDFLNVVVREKKRFEGTLDECVAQGLNAGVDGLMGQVDYLMSTRQGPRDYYPEKPEHMDLGNPTEACQDVIRCLKTHCSMLMGSTDKSVLEVFYQEVGLRLYALICKHLKRQIVSIDGGFKIIADLNAYHAFVASFLRQSQVTTYFDALKMLGNIYIIDHPRELGQIVRDANMFGGLMSPEELYEFLQARADFKSIEKAVDKEMYGFKTVSSAETPKPQKADAPWPFLAPPPGSALPRKILDALFHVYQQFHDAAQSE
ncbi:unnamed protein product [Tilletia controversa]|nr:unnamed protein product [Tilletia controversa]